MKIEVSKKVEAVGIDSSKHTELADGGPVAATPLAAATGAVITATAFGAGYAVEEAVGH